MRHGQDEESGIVETRPFLQTWAPLQTTSNNDTPTRNRKYVCFLIVTIIVHGLISYYYDFQGDFDREEIKSLRSYHPIRTNVIYGHLHFPKTGGTNLNGLMASKYDNVCGNKGYSYDAYQFNKRGKENNITRTGCNYDTITMAHQILGDKGTKCMHDGYGKERPRIDRGRPKNYVMDEIGYEICDYISNEIESQFWMNLTIKQKFHQRNLSLELHVPCREPIDHLMSIANHLQRNLTCPNSNNDEELRKSVMDVYSEFYDKRLTKEFIDKVKSTNEIELKCFSSFPIESYIEYMGQYLRPRRIPVEEYWPRDTNMPRNKTAECIWSQTEEYKKKVLQILVDKVPYFQFCHGCMGSKDQLIF